MAENNFFGLSDEDFQSLSTLLHHEEINKEDRATIASVRKSWQVLDITPEGVIIQTPSGKFRLQEDANGRLTRLERLFEEKKP